MEALQQHAFSSRRSETRELLRADRHTSSPFFSTQRAEPTFPIRGTTIPLFFAPHRNLPTGITNLTALTAPQKLKRNESNENK